MELILIAFFYSQFAQISFKYLRSRVGDRVNGMSHTIDQSAVIKRFFIQQTQQIRLDLFFILPVLNLFLHLVKHADYFQVCTAVFRSFQGRQGSSDS